MYNIYKKGRIKKLFSNFKDYENVLVNYILIYRLKFKKFFLKF